MKHTFEHTSQQTDTYSSMMTPLRAQSSKQYLKNGQTHRYGSEMLERGFARRSRSINRRADLGPFKDLSAPFMSNSSDVEF
jgi:hypothetical protein